MPIQVRCPHCGQSYDYDCEAGSQVLCRVCQQPLQVPAREKTAGGSVVYRHRQRQRPVDIVEGDSQSIERISKHIQHHLGPISTVFHEIISDLVHIDLHWVPPTEEMPCHTLVTSGMSDRPMNTPDDVTDCEYTELMIRLPPDWPISRKAFEDERNYWPIRWLKMLARFPHEYDTWLFMEHTVPNSDPPEPFAENTKFCGWLIYPPVLVPEEFYSLAVDDRKRIFFLAIYPLYLEEMNFKLSHGSEALTSRFEAHDVTEILDLGRRNVCKSRWWPFS